MPGYQYRPLAASGEIRVIRLQAGSEADAIVCRLETISLATIPLEEFNAISYAWESQAPTKSILLEGQDFAVTYNVFSIMKHIRLEHEEKTLWIDAVCINQHDVVERNHQVTQMRAIYGAAKQVIIWLGDDDDGIEGAFDGHDEKWADSTYKFFREPWWTRIWVLQEVVAAREPPVFLCGHRKIKWTLVPDFLSRRFRDKQYFALAQFSLIQWTKRDDLQRSDDYKDLARTHMFVDLIERLRRHGSYLSWDEYFSLRISMKATDARDYTYALISLMPHYVQFRIPVNYALDDEEVYLATALAAVRTDFGLALLSMTKPDLDNDRPTWWPSPEDCKLGIWCNTQSQSTLCDAMVKTDGKCMVVIGVLIDTVSEVAPYRSPSYVKQSQKLGHRCRIHYGLNQSEIQKHFWYFLVHNSGGSRAPKDGIQSPTTFLMGDMKEQSSQHTEPPPSPLDGTTIRSAVELSEACVLCESEQRKRRESTTGIAYPIPPSTDFLQHDIMCERLASRSRHHQGRFFATTGGYFGLSEDGIAEGDMVCILWAATHIVFILREHSGGYKLVGCARLSLDDHKELLSDSSISRVFKIY